MRIPRLPRLPRRLGLIALPLALGLAGLAWAERSGWLYHWFPQFIPPGIHLGVDAPIPLLRVVDGDTMRVRYFDLDLPIRLLCVDTEESVHGDAGQNTDFGAKTSSWAKDYLGKAQVRVEFKQRGWRIETDRYGRALAWLWIVRDGAEDELFNETLIRQGWSPYVTRWGNGGAYHLRLLQAEAQARAEGLGIWSRQ
ncbi:MAG: hypothetical protein EA402_01545 [Planctomycetota bacterium]|nr:MAG: hypothetical protein EA402_01545 [Planctomycetota bacterium]